MTAFYGLQFFDSNTRFKSIHRKHNKLILTFQIALSLSINVKKTERKGRQIGR